ncbi:hypothetical protein A5663_05685 [Mycobacterium sp. E740]|nr:hypothetical protein [Mycobacterium sp. E740]OBI74352.1 hypothetical protein A5663_05685 [Mycobacterium sp. E740]
MVAAAALQADGAALVICTVAVAFVLIGNVFRVVATLAVLSMSAAIVVGSAAPAVAAVCGLSAAAYLVLRHTGVISMPTALGALGFTTVALVAVALPLSLPWVPLVAPLAVLGAVVLATRPFWVSGSRS